MKEKSITQINVSYETKDKIKYIAKVLDKNIMVFMDELFDNLIKSGYQYRFGSGNINYEVDSDNGTVLVTFNGLSNFTSGITQESLDADIKRAIYGDLKMEYRTFWCPECLNHEQRKESGVPECSECGCLMVPIETDVTK